MRLMAGAASGPLFVVVVLVQAYTRAGFEPARHPLSSLALGDYGWVQIANFVVCGSLAVLGATGLRHAGTWGPRLLGFGGVALVVAGVFPPDPIGGYPAGAADTATWHGAVHSAAPALSGIAGLVAFVVFARRFAAAGRRGWAAWTIGAAVAVLAVTVSAAVAGDFRFALAGQAIGAAWTTSLFLEEFIGATSAGRARFGPDRQTAGP